MDSSDRGCDIALEERDNIFEGENVFKSIINLEFPPRMIVSWSQKPTKELTILDPLIQPIHSLRNTLVLWFQVFKNNISMMFEEQIAVVTSRNTADFEGSTDWVVVG